MTTGWILYEKSFDELTAKSYEIHRLLEAGLKKGIKFEVFKPEDFELVVSRSDKKSILIKGKVHPLPDFFLPRLGSKTTYFALAVTRQLERLGVFTCNSSGAIETVKDKLHIHQIINEANLPTPNSMLVKFPVAIDVVRREIGFPLVVKNLSGTEGEGVYLSDSEERFIDLMELIYSNNKNPNILLQEFIQTSRGSDLRVFTLGGRIIGCMKRTSQDPKFFKANVSKGANVEPFQLTPEIEWLATETSKVLNLDIAGVDLLFGPDGYFICEANSSPGFKGLEEVTGKVIAEQILDYILLRIGVNN